MIVRHASPDPRLSRIVRHYQSRIADLAGETKRIALPARTDVLIEFYFTAPHVLELQADRTLDRAPWAAAVGPQTHRRVDLILMGRLDIFTIHLTATGLHSLTGAPMSALTDAGVDATALFGVRTMRPFQERLAGAESLEARARIADAVLLRLLAGRRPPLESPIVAAGLAAIRQTAGSGRAGAYASAAGASERHFRRVFEEQVGMAPKLYARIVRLEAALRAKGDAPERSWTDIAHDCGWFDQAHMDKDFRALMGIVPSLFAPPSG